MACSAKWARAQVRTRGGAASLLDSVDFVSGVSGGSVTAAYYGLKRRAALSDFRERFLLQNAEESLSTRITPDQPVARTRRRRQRFARFSALAR